MASVDLPTARFARRPTRGVLLGLSAWRLAAVGTAVAVILLGLLPGAGGVGLLVGLIFATPVFMVAFVRVGGVPVVDWTPTITTFVARRACAQTEYRAKIDQPRPAGTLFLPGDAACLRFHYDRTSGACMIHDPHRQTLAAVLQVTHPAYVLLGADTQRARVTAWGRTLAGLATSGVCSCVQLTEATIPDAGQGIADWYCRHSASRGGWAAREYETLLATNQAGATTHRSTITFTLDLKAAARQIKASGGGICGAAHVLRQEMAALEYSLRSADLSFGAWMNETEIALIVRAAYDPAVGADFAPGSLGANLAHAGPVAVSETWTKIRHDSGWSVVLWISEWPRIEVPAHFLHAIVFTPGVRKTIALLARPKTTAEALRHIRRQKTAMIADAGQKAKVGQIQDLSDVQEFEDVLARERSLISGHADVDFTGLIAITAASEEELDAAARQVERAAGQAGCETRTLYGRQSQAFAVAALPIGRHTL
jgi:hypothetical protein